MVIIFSFFKISKAFAQVFLVMPVSCASLVILVAYCPACISTPINLVFANLEEIRIRNQKPIILKFRDDEIVIPYKVNMEEIIQILQRVCESSIYAYQNQICQGFVTVRGGHRVGITGEVILENGKVKNISYIYSLNFRIAKQIEDASIQLLKYILDIQNNSIYSTLIVGQPGTGKTTILKDLIKKLSNGIEDIGFKRNNSAE